MLYFLNKKYIANGAITVKNKNRIRIKYLLFGENKKSEFPSLMFADSEGTYITISKA